MLLKFTASMWLWTIPKITCPMAWLGFPIMAEEEDVGWKGIIAEDELVPPEFT